MHTRKKKDTGEPAFKTAPFSSLKGVKINEGRKGPVRPPVSTPEENVDDTELFLRAMNGARPVHDSDEGMIMSSKETVARKTPPQPEGEPGAELFLQAMRSLGAGALRMPADSEDDGEAQEKRSSSSRMRQLKKGTLRISGELDLHGFLRDEALRRLEHFVAAAYRRGQPAVLVITGKGINSSEGPVLRGSVEAWLRAKAGGMVAEFHPAPRDKGGSGAFVVFLKRK